MLENKFLVETEQESSFNNNDDEAFANLYEPQYCQCY